MVDVDDRRVADLHGVAVEVAAVQEDDRALREVRGDVADEPVELEERVLVGQRELVAADEHHAVLVERAHDRLHRDERAERVAVGVLVRHEDEAVGIAQGSDDLLARRRARAVDRHASSPSPGAASSALRGSPAVRSRSSSTRIARSVVSS